MNLGFRIAISEYFRKLFLDAFASNVKRKSKESYDLFRIIHVHIPEIIPPILTMHQAFLKVNKSFVSLSVSMCSSTST